MVPANWILPRSLPPSALSKPLCLHKWGIPNTSPPRLTPSLCMHSRATLPAVHLHAISSTLIAGLHHSALVWGREGWPQESVQIARALTAACVSGFLSLACMNCTHAWLPSPAVHLHVLAWLLTSDTKSSEMNPHRYCQVMLDKGAKDT